MPVYSFHCDRCERDFDRFLRPSEAAQGASCPECGKSARWNGPEDEPGRTDESRKPVCGLNGGT